MRNKHLCALTALSVLTAQQVAGAGTTWVCKLQSDADMPARTYRVAESRDTLSILLDEYSGHPTSLRIVENTGDGLIAIFHDSAKAEGHYAMRLLSFTIDRHSGDARLSSSRVGSRYEDVYRGTCTR